MKFRFSFLFFPFFSRQSCIMEGDIYIYCLSLCTSSGASHVHVLPNDQILHMPRKICNGCTSTHTHPRIVHVYSDKQPRLCTSITTPFFFYTPSIKTNSYRPWIKKKKKIEKMSRKNKGSFYAFSRYRIQTRN